MSCKIFNSPINNQNKRDRTNEVLKDEILANIFIYSSWYMKLLISIIKLNKITTIDRI